MGDQGRSGRAALARVTGPADPIELGAAGLTVPELCAIADGASVVLTRAARERIAAGRQVVDRAVAGEELVYGLNTGLGHLRDQRVPLEELGRYQAAMVRTHAGGIGARLPTRVVRAAMAVRAAGIARGGAGATLAAAETLVSMLNAAVHPVVPEVGSVGASDLMHMAAIALVAMGEGRAEHGGEDLDGASAMARAGIPVLHLAPKDGLAMISANGVSVGHGALVVTRAAKTAAVADAVLALSLEAVSGNPTIVDPAVAEAKGIPGQTEASEHIRALLDGSDLCRPGVPRSLQDPLSFRVAPQVHGAFRELARYTDAAVATELRAMDDNPLVSVADGRLISNGNFHPIAMGLAFDALRPAIAHVGQLSERRCGHLWDELFTDLEDLDARGHGGGRRGWGAPPSLRSCRALCRAARPRGAGHAGCPRPRPGRRGPRNQRPAHRSADRARPRPSGGHPGRRAAERATHPGPLPGEQARRAGLRHGRRLRRGVGAAGGPAAGRDECRDTCRHRDPGDRRQPARSPPSPAGPPRDAPPATSLRVHPASGVTRRERLVLATACLAGFTAFVDSSIVNLALPRIGAAFDSSASELAWVVNAYILPFAVSILAVGKLGDRYGRRTVLAGGAALFAVGSAGAALSPDMPVLLLMRVLQGLGGAALLTLSLAAVSAEFAPAGRPRALGIYFASGATAAAVGPIIGGVLTTTFGWPAIFALQVPLAIGVVVASLRVLERAPGGARRGLDAPGLALASLMLLGVNVALLQGGAWGWLSPATLAAWGLAVVGALGFVVREGRAEEPAVPLGVFRSRCFVASSVVGAAAWFGIISGSVQLAIYLQAGRGLDPTQAAIVLAPWPIAALIAFPRSGAVVSRYGADRVMLWSLLAATLSAVAMALFDGSTPLVLVSLAGAVTGVGIALAITASTVRAIAEFPPAEAGTASGVFNSIRQVGASLGVAIPAAAYDLATHGQLAGAAALSGSTWALGARAAVLLLLTACAAVLLGRLAPSVPASSRATAS